MANLPIRKSLHIRLIDKRSKRRGDDWWRGGGKMTEREGAMLRTDSSDYVNRKVTTSMDGLKKVRSIIMCRKLVERQRLRQ